MNHDWKDMLRRYIEMIADRAGTDFIGPNNRDRERFTEQEWRDLLALKERAGSAHN